MDAQAAEYRELVVQLEGELLADPGLPLSHLQHHLRPWHSVLAELALIAVTVHVRGLGGAQGGRRGAKRGGGQRRERCAGVGEAGVSHGTGRPSLGNGKSSPGDAEDLQVAGSRVRV